MTRGDDFDLGAVSDRLRVSIDHLMEGVQVIGFDWRYLYLNETAAAHGQRPVEDLLGRTIQDCFPGIEDLEVFDRLCEVMDDREPRAFRNEFVYPNGDRRWFDLRVDPVPAGICVISLDVTENHRMTQELQQSHERIEFALRAAQMGVWQLRVSTGEMRWSSTMADLGGVDPGDGPGTFDEFLEWVHAEDRQAIRAGAARVMREGGEFSVQFRIVRPDGHVRWMQAHARLAKDDAGLPDLLIGVGVDITARRSAEAQLQQAQKMEAVGQLAGGIAHDFNNQLAIVLGFTELARQAIEPDSQVARDLDEVRAAGERAMELTRQLLAFSRRQVLRIGPLDLPDVVRGVERLVRQIVGPGIAVELRLDPETPTVLGDAHQIEHVITNLALNARDAMPDGGRLTLTVRPVRAGDPDDEAVPGRPSLAGPRPYAMLEVADTGLGMNEATRQRLFEPFFTTKPPGKGTGLGLSTVYGIVQQLGGVISVRSEPGAGTTFRIDLPAIDAKTDGTSDAG